MTARSSAFYSHFPLGKTSIYAEPAKSVGVVTAFTVAAGRGERGAGGYKTPRLRRPPRDGGVEYPLLHLEVRKGGMDRPEPLLQRGDVLGEPDARRYRVPPSWEIKR